MLIPSSFDCIANDLCNDLGMRSLKCSEYDSSDAGSLMTIPSSMAAHS